MSCFPNPVRSSLVRSTKRYVWNAADVPANIGCTMVKPISSKETKTADIKAIGTLMMRMMELGTSLRHPRSLDLENPESWDDLIKDFLKGTATKAGQELLKVRC